MEIYQGKGVFPGVAFGRVHVLHRHDGVAEAGPAGSPEEEWARYGKAKAEADSQLEALYEKTRAEIGEEEAMIVDVQRMMLEDGDFNDAVEAKIREGASAPYAVSQGGKEFAAFFAALEDPTMKARATDVRDMSQRLVDVLLGRRSTLRFTKPVIVAADDLTPSETLQMNKEMVRAFVIRRGSANSHTAILAKMMSIPCIVQAADLPLDPDMTGRDMIVDGGSGICYLEPDECVQFEMERRYKEEQDRRALLDSMRGLPTVTKGGRAVKLCSNIGSVEDVDAVLEQDSEGIGLFRSEFLYLGRRDYPTEEELFGAYRQVAEAMGGRQVVVRTLDIGADKRVDYFGLDEEENPALGLRGVRLCIDRPGLFRTQLRAIYRASAFGSIAVMFPMITSLWEVRRCKELAAEVRGELTEEGISMGDVELGIMVETPAAAVMADVLAREVDFFSVGTNDLTQYTLAIDRQNNKLDRFYDPLHPAVLELLRAVAKAAGDNGIWAGVCGELAADERITEELVNMGYRELSVSPVYTLELRKRIREMN